MKRLGAFVFPVILTTAWAQSDDVASSGRARTAPWPEEVLRAAARMPVQEGGRIKPLHTFAGFQMLRLNGKRTFKTESGERLTPVAWMLDCLFFPEQARDYKIVRVDDSKSLEAIGVDTTGRQRRDRYSIREIEPYLTELGRQGDLFAKKPPDQRTPMQLEIVTLSRTVPQLEFLLGTFDFARHEYDVKGLPGFAEVFPGKDEITFLELAPHLKRFQQTLQDPPEASRDRLDAIWRSIHRTYSLGRYVHFVPPTNRDDEVYYSSADIVQTLFAGAADPALVGTLRDVERLIGQRGDAGAFAAGFKSLSDGLVARATERDEFGKIDMEVAFYESDWFSKAQYGFLIAFLCCAFLWMKPGVKAVRWVAWGSALSGEALLIYGIVLRCVIRSRPPVTTPYEAILFIVSVGVLIMLFVEWTRRTLLPLSLGALAGGLGIMLANWHEEIEQHDTMQPLVAVLDTNFWLSTHVTTVTLGYCAGSLAALLAHVYIFGKLFGYRRNDRKFYSDFSRIVYGVLCFGLLFSTVGTILGGVWANDSWGRFWGWDPKENGALMLVLGFLSVLHARLGGYLREFGIVIASVVLGIIVMWAFWGVNLYNIGLHSYGFTETKKTVTLWYYGVEWTVAGLGIVAWFLDRARKAKSV